MLIVRSANFLPLYSDNELLSLILPKYSRNNGYIVVNSKTKMYGLDGFTTSKDSIIVNGYDCLPLIRQLIEKNQQSVELTIESNRSNGYIIDKNGTLAKKYYSLNYLEQFKFEDKNPNFGGFISVSLPVYDEQRNLVLIYKSCKYFLIKRNFVERDLR